MAMTLRTPVGLRPMATRSRAPARVVCQAQREDRGLAGKLGLPVATLVATALLSGAIMPEEALAAKSSGRVGGSSGFKSRAAPAPQQRRTVVNNTVVVAPPVMAPPLFGGFGYGSPFGFSIMPTFVMPFPFFGGLFQFFFLMMIVSVVFGVVRNFMGGAANKKKDDDGWGDL